MRNTIRVAVTTVVVGGLVWWGVNAQVDGHTVELIDVSGSWDSRDLVVLYSACGASTEVYAAETSEEVTITVDVTETIVLPIFCASADAEERTVTLTEPLGDRVVIDAATGGALDVRGRHDVASP